MLSRMLFLTLGFLSLVGWNVASAADLVLKVMDKAPPAALSAETRATLQNSAVQLLEGDKPVFEFWLRKEIPLAAVPGSPVKALDAIKQATLLGAVQISSDQRDYRDDEWPAGACTIRFGLQPEDGNHLVRKFSYFAVLIPAKTDPKPDGIFDYKGMTKASSKETSTDHPRILSLRPVSVDAGTVPQLTEPAPAHKSVRVQVPAKAGASSGTIAFDLVYEGKAKK